MTAGFSLRAMLIALAIVALALAAAFVGLFSVIARIDHFNTSVANVREAQLNTADLLRLQTEEDTSVRGFAATHARAFADTYANAALQFPIRVRDVVERLARVSTDVRAARALADAVAVNGRWRRDVAQPVLSTTRGVDDRRARIELGSVRVDLAVVSAILVDDYHRLIRERLAAVQLASLIGYTAIVVVGLQIFVYAVLAERLRGELARERRIVTVLQRAFASEIVTDPQLDVGTTYLSATRGAKVGGDVYDIFPLDDDTTLIVIADVSGKGVEAAVDSMFVKYSLRALASQRADIATIVTNFNRLYARAQKAPQAFVVLFAAILDRRTATLSYVNAGHEAAYVRRPGGLAQLAPTGPIIGILDDVSFVAAHTGVANDDLLFLATDGLTEARDPSGAFLMSSGVETWLRESGGLTAQDVVDRLARRLRQYTRARSSDDLAMLAVRPKRAPGNVES